MILLARHLDTLGPQRRTEMAMSMAEILHPIQELTRIAIIATTIRTMPTNFRAHPAQCDVEEAQCHTIIKGEDVVPFLLVVAQRALLQRLDKISLPEAGVRLEPLTSD